jgi:hypothetical protein
MNWQGTEEQFAQLQDSTGIGVQEWQDLLSLPTREAQQEAIADWGALGRMPWAQRPDTLGEVLAILGVIGTIAGVISGVAGAFSAAAALRSL